MFDFKLSGAELDLILKGLMELPAKESMKLILKIDNSAAAQIEEHKKEEK